MFHIREIELVHWDFWRRLAVLRRPDHYDRRPQRFRQDDPARRAAHAVGVALLGKRDFRRYVRRARQALPWIRATVANVPARPANALSSLSCRQRDAGLPDPANRRRLNARYTIEVAWYKLKIWKTRPAVGRAARFRTRLAYAGLTPATPACSRSNRAIPTSSANTRHAHCWSWSLTCSATRKCWTTTRPPAISNRPHCTNWRASRWIWIGYAPKRKPAVSKPTAISNGAL